MTIQEILDQLREERRLLEQVIGNLEELARGRKRGPGRPSSRELHAADDVDDATLLEHHAKAMHQ
jgi:hypothetical protein